jgi:hypothetical protein
LRAQEPFQERVEEQGGCQLPRQLPGSKLLQQLLSNNSANSLRRHKLGGRICD